MTSAAPAVHSAIDTSLAARSASPSGNSRFASRNATQPSGTPAITPTFNRSRMRLAIAAAFASAGAHVLDTHLDADHHRAVVTLVGDDHALADGLVSGIAEARERIDLGRHDGVHPRIGAANVVPVVPLGRGDGRPGP